jgi:hypothetical protein
VVVVGRPDDSWWPTSAQGEGIRNRTSMSTGAPRDLSILLVPLDPRRSGMGQGVPSYVDPPRRVGDGPDL